MAARNSSCWVALISILFIVFPHALDRAECRSTTDGPCSPNFGSNRAREARHDRRAESPAPSTIGPLPAGALKPFEPRKQKPERACAQPRPPCRKPNWNPCELPYRTPVARTVKIAIEADRGQ